MDGVVALLLHRYVYGVAPPVAVALNAPFDKVQVAFVALTLTRTLFTGGTTTEPVLTQLLASVILKE